MFGLFKKREEEKKTAIESQESMVLTELRKRDLGVREMVIDLRINSPTKVISRLRKTHHIFNVGKGKVKIYHLAEIQ